MWRGSRTTRRWGCQSLLRFLPYLRTTRRSSSQPRGSTDPVLPMCCSVTSPRPAETGPGGWAISRLVAAMLSSRMLPCSPCTRGGHMYSFKQGRRRPTAGEPVTTGALPEQTSSSRLTDHGCCRGFGMTIGAVSVGQPPSSRDSSGKLSSKYGGSASLRMQHRLVTRPIRTRPSLTARSRYRPLGQPDAAQRHQAICTTWERPSRCIIRRWPLSQSTRRSSTFFVLGTPWRLRSAFGRARLAPCTTSRGATTSEISTPM